ncbi:hypothetical protein CPAR01_04451 [Colletotrichum paranaense]|uniref:Uncharacterized protein n=1 Tax=Colletotrichum paranaense TaxID=1914294 RepID=A0ABQ9SWD4_9PEZI|nr:uncharacterized protein CPAR01_04451 [Colletotrichum paranaense]KAK1543818.1 hypothetical protein CPAR01_04451 [Colletotrichum paranaense]
MKACSIVRKKFKTFRHYSREVRRIQKQVDRQLNFFTNEIHLLLRRTVEDEETIALMLGNEDTQQWHSNRIEEEMRKALDKDYDVCQGVVEDIAGAAQSFQDDFRCFDGLTAECRQASGTRHKRTLEERTDISIQSQGECLKDAVRRLRGRVKISLDESRFEKHIQDLRSSIDDLKRIREQRSELRRNKNELTAAKPKRGKLSQEYGHIGQVRRASKAFHEALAEAWSTSSTSSEVLGMRHTVRLFLDTTVKDDVQMHVAISCMGHELSDRAVAQERLARILVRSQIRTWIAEPDNSTSAAPGPDERPRQKRRKVRFSQDVREEASKEDDESDVTRNVNNQQGSLVNLCSKGLCPALNSVFNFASEEACSDRCLGYIDSSSQDPFRHSIYPGSVDNHNHTMTTSQALMSMNDVLMTPAESTLSIIDQLKLARDMVSAVLKFYSTPWLREYFTLRDLSFFQMSGDFSRCLRTLHLGFDFVQSSAASLPRSMEGIEATAVQDSSDGGPNEVETAAERAKLEYGIRNLTLWSLGITLLQIGRWSSLEAPEDVLSVRRLSRQVPTLGPKYRDLTRKCLECDFGFGDDLLKPRLQQAVYESVICELSDMINTLDVSDD